MMTQTSNGAPKRCAQGNADDDGQNSTLSVPVLTSLPESCECARVCRVERARNMDDLFRRKSISALRKEAAAEHGMRRVLGPVNLTTVGIGGIIGAGIFILTGQAAANYAGPAVSISFGLAALVCGFAGLCYAEFSSIIPVAGSAYCYAYATLGEFVAWFIGWDLILEYAIGAAAVAVGWSSYSVSLLRDIGVNLPGQLIAPAGTELVFVPQAIVTWANLPLHPGWHSVTSVGAELHRLGVNLESLQHCTAIFNLPAVLVVGAVTGLLVTGVRRSATINSAIVVLKVAVVLVVIGVGFSFVSPSHWSPFIPPNTGEFGQFGISGILRGAGVVFFAYIGFDAVSTAAQEARNPKRDMPLSILGSLAICTILYILMALVLTGVVPYSRLAVADPIGVAVDAMGIEWLAIVVKLGAIAGLTSVMVVLLLGQPRILYAMSRDGLLPPVFSKLHPRFRTPHEATLLTGGVVALAAAVAPIGLLSELVSIGTLAAFVVVCAGVLVLRSTHPQLPRAFRTPAVPAIPLLGIVGCLCLMLALPIGTWLRLGVWLVVGVSIYSLYGRTHSILRSKRPSPGGDPFEKNQGHKWFDQGLVHLEQQHVHDALQAFEKAMACGERGADVHFHLAEALIELEQHDRAIAELRAALTMEPSMAKGHCLLGVELDLLKCHQEAIDSFRAAIRLSPSEASYHQYLGLALETIGEKDQSLDSFKRALALRRKENSSRTA
jgi:basic amino acid/polyamine antiporter, APA family